MGGRWHLSGEQSHLIAGHLRGTCLGRAGRHSHLILGGAAGRALVSHSELGQSPNQSQPRAPRRTGWGFTTTSLQFSTFLCPPLPPPLQLWLCQPHQVQCPRPAPMSRPSIPGSQAVTLLTFLEEKLRPRWREASWLGQLGTITWRMKLPGSSLWRGHCPQIWVSALKSSWAPI